MNTLFDLSTFDTKPTLYQDGIDKLRAAMNFLTENLAEFDDQDEAMSAAVKIDAMMARLRVKAARVAK